MFSDIRLKDNLRHLGDIGPFHAFEWDWNELAPDPTQSNIGFIAQEVQETLPQFVGEKDGFLAIDYAGLLAHLGSDIAALRAMANNNKGKE